MTPRIHIALGGAALLVLVVAFAFGRSPQPELPVVVPDLMPPKIFVDPFHDIGIEALKSAMTGPKVVKTETILPPDVEVIADVPLPKPRPVDQYNEIDAAVERQEALIKAKRSLDVCQQHGMHKVFFGKTWRCKR